MLQTVLCGAACAAAAYLLGSLSFSIIVTRLLYHKDIRTFGSGNAGMTNVLRTFGKGAAALTIVGDIGKGILAVLLAKWAFGAFTATDPIYGAYIAAFCAVLGHVYPVYFGFKGGKGVACSAAVVFFVDPLWGAVAIVACLAVIALTRFISLGSMTMLFCYMVLMCIAHWGQWAVCLFTAVLFAMCVWRHRSNIQRLLSGTENRIGQKAK